MSSQGYEALVILDALTPGIYPEKRTLTLTSGEPPMVVGRASKSLSKGLLADVDNAWFDSPVMSRSHAELRIDTENICVSVVDISSMHGTRLNNSPLVAGSSYPLSDNDVITFGTEVRRGLEVFQACRFRITYTIVPIETFRGSSTFKVPYSDVDEQELSEEDYYGVEDDDDESEEAETPPEMKFSDEAGIVSPTEDGTKELLTAFEEIEESVIETNPQSALDEIPTVDETYTEDHSIVYISDNMEEEDDAAEPDDEEIPSGQGYPHDFRTILNSQESADYVTNLEQPQTFNEAISNIFDAQPQGNFDTEYEQKAKKLGDEGLVVKDAGTTDKSTVAHAPPQEDTPGNIPIGQETSQPAAPIIVHHLSGQQWKEARAKPLQDKKSHLEIGTGRTEPEIFESNTVESNTRQSPELDMTSAVRFARSKKLAEQNNPSKRRGTKRKAIQISELLEEERALEVSPNITTDTTNNTSREGFQSTTANHSADVNTPVVSEPESSDRTRYSKRLKKFAEAAGYAALGGVAVGAGLFSLLVATAPDFA